MRNIVRFKYKKIRNRNFSTQAMACSKATVPCIIFLAVCIMFFRVCALNECYSDSDCSGFFSSCCKRKYQNNVCRFNCFAQSNSVHCSTNSDCASSKSCCGDTDTCSFSCLGRSCTHDKDCGSGECCDIYNTCSSVCDVHGLAEWIITVIVVTVIITTVTPIAAVVYCCCSAAATSRRSAHGGVVITQFAENAFISTQQGQLYPVHQGPPMYVQTPQHYPNQLQQASPNHRPQTYPINPPSY